MGHEPPTPLISVARRGLRVGLALLGVAGVLAALVAAAEKAGGRHQETWGREDEEEAERREDPDDLDPVPQDGGSRVTQLAFASPAVVVTEEKVVLEGKRQDASISMHISWYLDGGCHCNPTLQ